MQKIAAFLLCLLIWGAPAKAQKKNLSAEDYGKWQSIGASELSPNGNWIAYQIIIQEDNDSLYVVNRSTNKTYKLAFASSPELLGFTCVQLPCVTNSAQAGQAPA